MDANPLLSNQELPAFTQIKAHHVEDAVTTRLAELEKSLSGIEAKIVPTWEGLVEPLCQIEEKLHRTWSPVDHLNHVANSEELRAAYEKAHKLVVDFQLRYMQSQPIFEALLDIQNGKQWKQLDEAQQRCIELRIRSAKLSGLALKGKDLEEFNALNKDLSQLEFDFSNKLLDASKEFLLPITNAKDMEGIPQSTLELTSQIYNQKNPGSKSTASQGPWAITLDAPVFVPFLENCGNRDLRKQVYLAYVTRASSGKFDNTSNILGILKIRKRIAKLLGFQNYAELSIARKMVPSVADVFRFQEELRAVSYKKSKEEFEELQKFAKSKGAKEDLRQWDIAFWAQRLQEERFQFKEEDLKPYFAFDQVLEGMFALVKKLFAVSVKAEKNSNVWNADVRFYKVFNDKDQHIASFYLDAYTRMENKRGGAWVNDCLSRFLFQGKLTLPVAYVVCNFSPPVDKKPSLLTFDEVTTIFHEFGHALQHMLTSVHYRDVSGFNGIEWDAVELASQFMENWCYHRKTLQNLGKHFQTGETIPDALMDKVIEARTFRAASHMLRQLQFGLIDMNLHYDFEPDGKDSILNLHKEVVQKTSILPYLPEDRTLWGFSHIFAGGYAAGYYSYKWAETMSADAFAKFEEEGLDKEDSLRNLGRRFRDTILALGGGRAPLKVFVDFRGREPSTDALLRHSGLLGKT